MRARTLATALAALGLLGAGVKAEPTYTFVIPTETAAGITPDPDLPLRVAATARDLSALARTLGVAAPPTGATRLEFTIDAYPQLPLSPAHDVRAPSFALDYDEPAVDALRLQIVAEHGAAPTRAHLITFVDAWITNKSMERGMDFASRTATDRVGDCTEHAFLLAALARAVGLEARVTFGLAILEVSGSLQSFGHAWAEIREDGRWLVSDAALAGAEVRVRYVPYGVLDDEGPGFAIAVMRLTPRWIQRVEILGDVPPVGASRE
jgi:transglutaminase-like putative cysteine protease